MAVAPAWIGVKGRQSSPPAAALNRPLWLIRPAAAAVLALCLALGFVFGGAAASRAAELVMFERDGCPWCAAWDREIAPIYPKTEAGRLLPLRRVAVEHSLPEDLSGLTPVRFTPTFVAWACGREIGRILGYAGEAEFWGLVEDIAARLPPSDCSEN